MCCDRTHKSDYSTQLDFDLNTPIPSDGFEHAILKSHKTKGDGIAGMGNTHQVKGVVRKDDE